MMTFIDVPTRKDSIVVHLGMWKPVLFRPNNSRIMKTSTTLFEGAIAMSMTLKGKLKLKNWKNSREGQTIMIYTKSYMYP